MLKLENREVGIGAVKFVVVGEYIYEMHRKRINKTTENKTVIKSLDK